MKFKFTHIIALLIFAVALFVPVLGHAQDAAAAVPSDTVAEAPGWLDAVLAFTATLGTKFGVVGKIFGVLATISGVCALTIKPIWDKFIFPSVTAYVQSTASKNDDAWLAAFLQNKVVKLVLYILNILAHIKIPIIDKDGAAVSPSSAGTTLPPSK